ncbi:unnamed protein product [Linum trigynum]|uniref:Uncharacterized protein n=1 Tax=Linum trigynum TaxID=586398 RepID=A0AAV2G746_9ROSI
MNTPPGSQGRLNSSSGNASQGSQGTQAGNGTGPRAFQFGTFDERQQHKLFAGARNDVITFGSAKQEDDWFSKR